MRTPATDDPDPATVEAARGGDPAALAALAAAYLPLVYNVVGRAMNGHPDVDDVVQETMLRAVRGIGELRDAAACRSWLMAIAIRQVRDSYRDRLAQAPAADALVMESAVPVPDFAEQTIERLGLSGQRRQAAEATRWLDDDDRPVLALWWQEAAGELTRVELAAALGLTPAHAAVRVARMKERLATARMVVHALGQAPLCGGAEAVAARWDGAPSPLWRKRLARHVRDCRRCAGAGASLLPAERLLAGLPLLAVPAGLAGHVLGAVAGASAAVPGAAVPGAAVPAGVKAALATMQPKLVAAALVLATGAAGGTFAVTRVHHQAAPAAAAGTSLAAAATRPVPLVTGSARLKPAVTRSSARSTPAAPASSPAPATSLAARPAATSQRKGVSVWNFAGGQQALAESGASWYYNWAAAPDGISGTAAASFVPMIRDAAGATAANLNVVSREGPVLLGFNEPDLASQANMTVAQALDRWPGLMATGLTLGSPAVASGAATPGGWLDQFMAGARARGYRVDFIAVHWYGADFSTGPAVQQLESYLAAVYARYHLPVWVTEFALTSYGGAAATFPSEAQQAAFLTAATTMLDGLPYVQRYAWFALPASSGSGTTGLFDPGPVVTPVGRAFEAAR